MTDDLREPASDPVVDWASARRNIPGGADGIRRLAGLMGGECERLLVEIREGLAAARASQVRVAAHTLRGGARHFGARGLVEAAGRVEDRAAAGDLEAARDALPALEAHGKRFVQALGEVDAALGRGDVA